MFDLYYTICVYEHKLNDANMLTVVHQIEFKPQLFTQ